MRIVFAKHEGEDKEYCFEVPEIMNIQKGDILLVDTMRGTEIATATSYTIIGENVEQFATRCGAYLPLKKVITYASEEMQKYIHKKTVSEIIKTIKTVNDDIPF